MGSGTLPLILLLMSFFHAGLTQAIPKPVVKVSPDQRVFRGETVTLTCDIQRAGDIQWTYSWFKDGNTFYPYPTTAAEYSFIADESDSGNYSCRGQRSDSQRSHTSAAVTLSVSGLPRSILTVPPDSPVFTGETVTLKCVIESHSNWRYEWTPEWRYEWNKGRYYSVMLQTSERYTVNRDTLTIRGVITSDQDYYWCRGQIRSVSSQSSSSVYFSVNDSPRSTLTVTPDSPVFTGETVTLKCVINSDHSDWRYEWYKGTNNSAMLQTSERYTVNRDTLTIRGVITADAGQFTCRGQRDGRSVSSQESNRIHLSVNASSSLLVIGVVVGLSVCLLFFISLLLLWRYKKNKDQQRNINQTSVPNQSGESQPQKSPLQSDSDHIYDDVTEVNKRHKDDSESFLEVTYSEVIWSYVNKDDSMAESNDVTYSEVIPKVKKCKDADAGVGDAIYAQPMRKKGKQKK